MKPTTNSTLPDDPFIIRMSIEDAVGAIEDARPEARGARYVLNTAITIEFHETLNIRKCTVTCHSGKHLSDNVLTGLGSQRVINVRRFTRRDPTDKKKFVPTNAMVLTFQGTTVPEYIYFGYEKVATHPYYPSPLQCSECHRFRHTRKFCTEAALCADCSSEHVDESTPCSADPLCINCSGPHSSRSRDCPVKISETKIVKIKVDQDVTYTEARKVHESRKEQGPTMSSTVNDLQKKLQEKDQEIAKLRTLLQNLIREVADLKKQNQQPASTAKETEDGQKMDTTKEQKNSKRQRSKDISPINSRDHGRNSPSMKKSSGKNRNAHSPTIPTKERSDPTSEDSIHSCISPTHSGSESEFKEFNL
ncbi:uncharacterized protein LOC134290818 [Aedes albopictus]|uniref:Uncharacterized protein n=1 Tax=Aedes albopictus TaxID=7160 RepID=A0ABM1Z5X2_AEDAL